ncbi:hypothetical protein ABN224_16795 [Providencia rettgeri]
MKIIILLLWIYMIFVSSAQGSIFTIQQSFSSSSAEGFLFVDKNKCPVIESNLCHQYFEVPSGLTYTVKRFQCIRKEYNDKLSNATIIGQTFYSGSMIPLSFFRDENIRSYGMFSCALFFDVRVTSDKGLESLNSVSFIGRDAALAKLIPKKISIDIADNIELRPNQIAQLFKILPSSTGRGRIHLDINFPGDNNIKRSLIQYVDGRQRPCGGVVKSAYICDLVFDGKRASWYGSKSGTINILLEIK